MLSTNIADSLVSQHLIHHLIGSQIGIEQHNITQFYIQYKPINYPTFNYFATCYHINSDSLQFRYSR